jgi:DNA-binding LytR/AlgR family response regulator
MRTIDYTNQNGTSIFVMGKFYPLNRILYLKCDANYTGIYLIGGDHTVPPCERKTLKEFEEELKDFGFQRINRNTIINQKHIDTVIGKQGEKFVRLKKFKNMDEIELKISRRNEKHFK